MVFNYKTELSKIKTFIFDVDGVFTDNIVYLTADGEQMRTANVRDGYAVQLAVKKGIQIAIISGGKSEAVRKRFEGLGVQHIHLGSSNKVEVLERVLATLGITDQEVCYMGDDIPDHHVMSRVALAVCPADAAPEIRAISHYVSPKNGGHGCVRDVLEQALKLQGHWMDDESRIW
jgi:3-deoxy-D-manno-octulosonate 8-phosphate phosphatase (KDO 8-P phosphatase)